VYLHMAAGIIEDEELNAYNYFERRFSTYQENFKLLFKYAHKIIAITEQIKDYTIQRYEIEDASKCIVLPNCINFEEYKSNIEVNQVEKVLIVSRLSYEKLNSITNAIKLYEKIKEKSNKKVSLTIVGGGNEEDTIKRYIEDNNIQDVEFKGKVSNINKILEEYDLLIGLDRCILEAIATKRLAVISGYDGIKGLIDETITIGSAFGGDYECINIYTALITAKEVLNADVVFVSMGPGIAGTGTKYGFTGIEQGPMLDAVKKLGGMPISIPRVSFADKRNRHKGISHHSITVLKEIVNVSVNIPICIYDDEKLNYIKEQIKYNELELKHNVVYIKNENSKDDIEYFGLKVRSMGRNFDQDKEFFEAASTAAYYLVEVCNDIRRENHK